MIRFRKFIGGVAVVGICMMSLTLAAVAQAAESFSSVPTALHYQANMETPEGLHVDGDVNVRVFLFDSATLGSSSDLNDSHVLYAEDQGVVRVDRGVLRFTIGEGNALGQFAGAPLPLESLAVAEDIFVGLEINGETIAPRQKMAYRNAAVRAQYARKAQDFSGELRVISSNIPDLPASKVEGILLPDRIPQLDVSYLQDAVDVNRIPPNIPVSKITGDIAEDAIPEFDASRITSGDFTASQMPNTLMLKGDVGAAVGTFHGGGVGSIPAGFAAIECKWFPAVGNVAYGFTGNANPAFVMSDGIDEIDVHANYGLPIFSCNVKRNNGGTVVPCYGTYLIVCAH